MTKSKIINLGRVIKIENNIALTDTKNRSGCKCEIGDVLIQDEKTRKVSVKEKKNPLSSEGGE
ncbi:MAG: hypothetical protein COB42_08155 [Sulfurimonas sp.]|nr:MAG: hypothetical protein COB42_08155 [Sulfurimonas sp.]